MDIQKSDTAVVFIDPQNDVLSKTGANWGAVGASVTENSTVENMERIFKAAKADRSRPTNSGPTPLPEADRVWLKDRCRAWAGKFDRYLSELERGTSPLTVREEMDATVKQLSEALRKRAAA